jgi:hypothetical protein
MFVSSHLGFQLREGDLCLGYDLEKLNLEGIDNLQVVLVKKLQEKRKRKVHRMNIDLMGENNIHKNTKSTHLNINTNN